MISAPPQTTSRSPVQGRSRASTERMLSAATDLFLAGGYEAVTASEVSRRAGVAVGTIYGRFGNKDGLVHAVETDLLGRFEDAVQRRAASPEWTATAPERLVPTLIASLADLLCEHAATLQPIMQHAPMDARTAQLGKAGYEKLRLAFHQAAGRARPTAAPGDLVAAIESCFKIAYATFARALALGSSADVADAASIPQLARDLGSMCTAFLARV